MISVLFKHTTILIIISSSICNRTTNYVETRNEHYNCELYYTGKQPMPKSSCLEIKCIPELNLEQHLKRRIKFIYVHANLYNTCRYIWWYWYIYL